MTQYSSSQAAGAGGDTGSPSRPSGTSSPVPAASQAPRIARNFTMEEVAEVKPKYVQAVLTSVKVEKMKFEGKSFKGTVQGFLFIFVKLHDSRLT